MSPTNPPSNPPSALPRSPELMSAADTTLLVVDVQERFMPVIRGGDRLVWNIRRLVEAAQLLGVNVVATEQVPAKLGPTVPSISELLPTTLSKTAFSCGEQGDLLRESFGQDRHRVLLCGLETHVCVQQTALDYMAAGATVYAAVDALSTRHEIDHEIALRRMESSGVTLTTCEAAILEWCQVAGGPNFKQISALLKQSPPD